MKKLAIVYDWLDTNYGGAEYLLKQLFDHYSEADIYVLFADYRKALWAKQYASRIQTTFLQNIYSRFPHKKYLTFLMPAAIESLNLSAYERVLSVSSAFAKAVLTRPETKHVCYLLTPTRFLWQEADKYKESLGFGLGSFSNPFKKWLQAWDKVAINRPDIILTLSEYSKKQIKKVYGKEAIVLYPPFEKRARSGQDQILTGSDPYFLYVGRLEPYKNVDLLIKTFAEMPEKKLQIVGTGSQAKKLQKQAARFKNISFRGSLDEEDLLGTYANASALIMPQREDFGYTALEALSLATPVISLVDSGVAEIVEAGQNGTFFKTATTTDLKTTIEKFEVKAYNSNTVNWEKFSQKNFLKKLDNYLFR